MTPRTGVRGGSIHGAVPVLRARAQQILERLSLDGLVRHAPRNEARHRGAIRTSQRGRVRIADQVQAVAFWQLLRSACSYHASLNGVPRRPDHTLIRRSAWKGRSPKSKHGNLNRTPHKSRWKPLRRPPRARTKAICSVDGWIYRIVRRPIPRQQISRRTSVPMVARAVVHGGPLPHLARCGSPRFFGFPMRIEEGDRRGSNPRPSEPQFECAGSSVFAPYRHRSYVSRF
jgi:hypothetical protein